jgi:hypothetical protein
MKTIISFFILLILAGTSAAQTKVVPIIDMKMGGLLGGVENGKFLDAKSTAEKLSGELNYTLYLLGGRRENLLLGKPTNSSEICEDFFALEMDGDAEARHKKGGVALGSGFRWNPQPRAVTPIALNNAAYKKIMNDFLRTKRITTPVAKLDQAFRVDLDGDGREEVVLTATRVIRNFEPGRERKRVYDAYSVVLIRKIVNGRTRNIVVEGEFSPKSDVFYDGYTYEVSSVADLNGDGKMEILMHGEYYEGSNTAVLELNGGKVSNIEGLGAGCGI